MSKAKTFFIICIAFVIGVGIRSFLPVPFIVLYCAGLSGAVVSILAWKNPKIRIIGLCLIAVAVGVVRYDFSEPRVESHDIQFYNGNQVRIIGVVNQEPDTRQNHVKLTVSVIKGIEGVEELVSGKMLVRTTLYPEYNYGDALDISCTLEAPGPLEFETESGIRIFRYDNYLARFGIYSLCYRPKISILATHYGNPIMESLLSMKAHFTKAIQQTLAEPYAAFLGGLVLGTKKSIPDNLMESFNRTGTTHIVALSGYNITIIAVLIMNICKQLWISRKNAFWVSLGAITFFVTITGAQASVMRAGIMGMLVLLATQVGRMSRITNTLALAAVVMVMVNPRVLVFDAGFQLSFFATIGLVYISPRLERFFKWMPNVFEIRTSLVATLSATLMTLPLILFQFGRLSVVAPLVNVLILPAIPIAMAVGFIAAVVTFIWIPAGQIIGWIVWCILSYIIVIVEWFSTLDFASFAIGNVSWVWLVAGYGIIALPFLVSYIKKIFYEQNNT